MNSIRGSSEAKFLLWNITKLGTRGGQGEREIERYLGKKRSMEKPDLGLVSKKKKVCFVSFPATRTLYNTHILKSQSNALWSIIQRSIDVDTGTYKRVSEYIRVH
jgi:hypothetical protein